MLIPSIGFNVSAPASSLSRRVNANSQLINKGFIVGDKLIKKGEC